MSEEKKSYEGVLLGMGNPLLDISAEVEQDLFDKYGLKPGNAILAEEKHLPLYNEMVVKYPVEYIAGGATQNSIRVAQWMLGEPNATSYIGCIGDDEFGKKLREAAAADGVNAHYLVDPKAPTGTCACLIKDKERSLVANLAAANNYKMEHLMRGSVQPVWDNAKVFYISGFFLTVSPESIMQIAKHSHEKKKTFMMNLSAPFICDVFAAPLMEAMPYVDVLIGNEDEAKAFSAKQGFGDDLSIPDIALKASQLEKANGERARMVIITQGAGPTCVAVDNKVSQYDVPKIESDKIVDSNGAGDAFVGGFLSQYVKGADIKKCVDAGHYAAGVILGVSGTVMKSKPTFE